MVCVSSCSLRGGQDYEGEWSYDPPELVEEDDDFGEEKEKEPIEKIEFIFKDKKIQQMLVNGEKWFIDSFVREYLNNQFYNEFDEALDKE